MHYLRNAGPGAVLLGGVLAGVLLTVGMRDGAAARTSPKDLVQDARRDRQHFATELQRAARKAGHAVEPDTVNVIVSAKVVAACEGIEGFENTTPAQFAEGAAVGIAFLAVPDLPEIPRGYYVVRVRGTIDGEATAELLDVKGNLVTTVPATLTVPDPDEQGRGLKLEVDIREFEMEFHGPAFEMKVHFDLPE